MSRKNFDEANVSIPEEEENFLEFKSSQYKAFIYKQKKRNKGKSIDTMQLDIDKEKLGHVDKLNNLRKAKLDNHNNDSSSGFETIKMTMEVGLRQ